MILSSKAILNNYISILTSNMFHRTCLGRTSSSEHVPANMVRRTCTPAKVYSPGTCIYVYISLSVFVNMCIYIYIYIFIYLSLSLYIDLTMYRNVCQYLSLPLHIYTHIYIYLSLSLCIYKRYTYT